MLSLLTAGRRTPSSRWLTLPWTLALSSASRRLPTPSTSGKSRYIAASAASRNALPAVAALAWSDESFHVWAFACRWAWPLYWFAQGTMFWALFVVGHDW